jgi:hypothetical protein
MFNSCWPLPCSISGFEGATLTLIGSARATPIIKFIAAKAMASSFIRSPKSFNGERTLTGADCQWPDFATNCTNRGVIRPGNV